MKEFTDLQAWQEAHKLTLIVYEATKGFPREEQFSLTSQVRRSVASIEANIAEGHGRFRESEFHQFCNIARGSLSETHCHLLVARDLGYLSLEHWRKCYEQIVTVRRLIQGLMRHLRESQPGARSPEPGASP